MIFKTERLTIRRLQERDKDLFFEMMSNPNVMLPIPQKPLTKMESDAKFLELTSKEETSPMKIWSVTKKEEDDFIGICGFLKNNEGEDEIAYRLIERYWGNGYGTEIAKNLIGFGFEKMHTDKITADVNIENLKSVKILAKFLNPVKEFYNEKDKCVDRRYAVFKRDFVKN